VAVVLAMAEDRNDTAHLHPAIAVAVAEVRALESTLLMVDEPGQFLMILEQSAPTRSKSREASEQ
jgi:hypothetical protein